MECLAGPGWTVGRARAPGEREHRSPSGDLPWRDARSFVCVVDALQLLGRGTRKWKDGAGTAGAVGLVRTHRRKEFEPCGAPIVVCVVAAWPDTVPVRGRI